MGVDHELLVGAQVEQAAGGIVRAGGKCVAIGEELQGECELLVDSIRQEIICTASPIPKNTASRFNILLVKRNTHTDGVDVRLVASEGLSAHALTDVPEFSRGVTGP